MVLADAESISGFIEEVFVESKVNRHNQSEINNLNFWLIT